jgi:hypothetical protein
MYAKNGFDSLAVPSNLSVRFTNKGFLESLAPTRPSSGLLLSVLLSIAASWRVGNLMA